jgi:hypothetical protein
VNRSVFGILVLAVLLGAALYGYLRAARTVGERWPARRWRWLGVGSAASALVFLAVFFGRRSWMFLRQTIGALIIAAVAVAAFWIPAALRRRSRPSS